ncbi:MAG: 3-hydroxyacyl-ACP dehydratase FabZ [Paracoccaceae bacterium]|nr:3-hydroxyacyl-ACP dehydratase FabZ [Paracoccaceae bacterium]
MTETTKTADIATILRAIPHRYPFLLIDKVVEIDGTKRGVGIKNVSINEPFFQGHFPVEPVMPGVLIIEAMAQTSAVIVSIGQDLMDSGALVYFMGIDKAKFRRKVVPGDRLEMELVTLRGGGKVWRFQARATVGGELACECELMAMIQLPPAG